VTVVALLLGLLLPAIEAARIKAKVVKAHAELRGIGVALETYYEDHRAYPPARTYCAGMSVKIDDYNEIPDDLFRPIAYLSHKGIDPFNAPHTYKYISPGPGFSNGMRTILPIWVPADFPGDSKPCTAYYRLEDSPVKWALWSVGPAGALSFWQSEAKRIPVPKHTWYDPANGVRSAGVITHLSTGHQSK